MSDAHHAHVLVVDDERFFREAISEVLGGQGIPFVLAETGEEALERAEAPAIGVVVLDLNLPDLHGLEVFRRLRERRPELRVVILSASTGQDDVLEALRLGAFDYLAKPLHEEELALAVRRARETFAVASGWARLRARLSRLEETLGGLARLAERSDEDGGEDALRAAAVAAAADVLGAAKTSLVLLDEVAGEGQVVACHGRKEAPEALDPVPLGEGVAGRVLARGEPLLVRDLAEDPRFAGRPASDRYASRSFVLAPLQSGGRTLGVLCATDRAGGEPFAHEDLALLRILAAQLAALEARTPAAAGATGADDAEEGAGDPDAELARAICEAVTREVEPTRILEAALEPVARSLEAAPVSLYLVDPQSGDLVREAQSDGARRGDRARLPVGRGLTGGVLESGQLVAADDVRADPRFDPEVDTPEGGGAGPLLCGPLRFRGKALGVFRAFPARAAEPRTGELLSAALSAAVRNVLLYRSLVQSIEEVAEARRSAQRVGVRREGAV